MTVSIVTLTWNKDPKRLRDLLWTLTHQTVLPDEIVVVDGNTDPVPQADTIEAIIPFANHYRIAINVILAHMDRFNLSKGINIGIKNTSESSDYIIAAGIDMLFGPNVVETILSKLTPNRMCVSQCGFLTKDVYVPNDVFSAWDMLCDQIDPNPPIKISTGAAVIAPRDWFFKYRGYDEINNPFAYTDSDITLRMELSGLKRMRIYWNEMQLIHVWHELSPLVAELGGDWPDKTMPLVRNPDGWGEYD